MRKRRLHLLAGEVARPIGTVLLVSMYTPTDVNLSRCCGGMAMIRHFSSNVSQRTLLAACKDPELLRFVPQGCPLAASLQTKESMPLNSVILALTLTLAPYSGIVLNGSVPGSTKFMVDVHGNSRQAVRLQTLGVPNGYIASFCTNRVCAPFRVELTLPRSGREQIELQLVENVKGSPRPRTVTVSANDHAQASIAFSRGIR